MPKECTDIKAFVQMARQKEAQGVVIAEGKDGAVKFKLRMSKYLYTLTVTDADKAKKITAALPPGLIKTDSSSSSKSSTSSKSAAATASAKQSS